MGRRKIAIEPITHERNRSVTFLKRKHGLFKKAYELGVLCSVDVAVIIFEEKPGHHLKLYQYCSSDVHEMVQRHIRHDGEKDTRGPVDFSGVPNAKFEEFGDGDDDEVDDDDDPHRAVKRSSDGHIKSEDISLDVDLSYPQSHIFETPSYSNVPINSDRRLHQHHSSSLPNKRVRTGDLSGPGARSPRSNNPYISPTVATSQPFGRSQHADNSFFASPTSPQTFNTESNFDVTHPNRDQLTGVRNGSSGTPSYPPRSTAYDAALYTPLIRHSSNNLGNGGSEGFKFLDGDSRSRASATSGHLGTNLNWPDHGNSAYNSNPSAASTNESTWLDFLNPGHGGHSGANPVVNASDVPGRRNSQTQSWERGPSSTRNSMSSPFTRSIPTAGDGSRRSRLTSSGSAGDDEASSGGNSIPSGIGNTGISIKKEKDIGG